MPTLMAQATTCIDISTPTEAAVAPGTEATSSKTSGTKESTKATAAVTGVDISDEAISSARRLSSETGIAADFMRADVYDWLKSTAHSDRRFDVVFSSYGVVC